MSNKILIFDTTLRDGEQCPGASMTLDQKLIVAHQLEKLGVDVIEAGFPCISQGDFNAVYAIASKIKSCRIACSARCVENDIVKAAEALAPAQERGRICTFIATSPLHREFKLKKSKEEIMALAVKSVSFAKSLMDKTGGDVEFIAEDATRTELDYLAQVCEAVIQAGATTITISDTVGFITPNEYKQIFEYLKRNVSNIDQAVLSVHCHNDLGLAVANSLAAVGAGARQIGGTINGIGERAGNAALEEIIMALNIRPEVFGFSKNAKILNINTKEIVKTSQIVALMSGLAVQRSKAIVGENAFAHSSGIHQHGVLANRETYEIINPQDVGWDQSNLPLTKHSGGAALKMRLEKLNISVPENEFPYIFEQFKKVGDSKKFVYDDDLKALVGNAVDYKHEGLWKIESLRFFADGQSMPTATLCLVNKNGEKQTAEGVGGKGVVEACFKAIEQITQTKGTLVDYSVHSTTDGKDSLGEVTVKIRFEKEVEPFIGKSASFDVIDASVKAYLNAVNLYLSRL